MLQDRIIAASAWATIALLILLSSACGPKHSPGAIEANERALLNRIKQYCYTTDQGQAVYYTDALGCPDRAEIEAETLRLNQRIGLSHPFMVSGSAVIFTRFVPCYPDATAIAAGAELRRGGGCWVGYTLYVLAEPGDYARPRYLRRLMHEDCHYIKWRMGLDPWHHYITAQSLSDPRVSKTVLAPDDKHFYEACSGVGSTKRWSHHLELELKRMERFQ